MAKTLTCSLNVGKSKNISEQDLFYYLAGCPFFRTYEDEETQGLERALLPLFRFYHFRRYVGRAIRYAEWVGILNKFLEKTKATPDDIKLIFSKGKRYFTNFYSLFHSSKQYTVLFPYFPYIHAELHGCIEVVLRSSQGVRLYSYDFGDQGVGAEDLNRHGFKLQLAARIFHLKTGIEPSSMATVYPATKTVVYFTYRPEEKLEELVGKSNTMVRRYGSYCADCTQRNCRPLIDRTDRYGWSYGESEDR